MADNAVDPRRIMILLEILSASVLLFEAMILIPDPKDGAAQMLELSCGYCLMLFLAGIEIINLMQLFNWFNKKTLGSTISFWLLSKNLGFVM